MTRELLIKKWLNHELNPEELKAFKALEDYEDLIKLDQSIQRFKAPEYNQAEALKVSLERINTLKPKKANWLKPLMRIAAVLVIALGFYFVISGFETTYTTNVAQQIETVLPDKSEIILNATSRLSFNKRNWSKNRLVNLEGEAFFKVAKGSKFNVVTSEGVVTVLGTEFNVKQRDNFFEVYCFEGSVGVDTKDDTQVLKPGESYRVINGKIEKLTAENTQLPSWLSKESSFENVPVYLVFDELQRQYKVKINVSDIDETKLFTGTFTHANLNLALKSITIPLNLTYKTENEQIIIMRD